MADSVSSDKWSCLLSTCQREIHPIATSSDEETFLDRSELEMC